MTINGVVSFSLMKNRVCIFLLIRILLKTMPRKFQGLCSKSLGDSSKDRCFLSLHNDSKKMFVNKNKGKWFFNILTMLSDYVYIDLKFYGKLRASISFPLKSVFTCSFLLQRREHKA